jgi:hypothetical protein
VCVPGKTTCVAAWMKKCFEIILEVDTKAQLRTNTGKVIKQLEDFPVGQKFSDAFKPVQSDDTKSVKIVFCMTSALLGLWFDSPLLATILATGGISIFGDSSL